ncbi:protein phosphatase 2C domain-containing protein [Sphaerimonospora mesophila]|uniref:PP2C family protein-serine/threonine phosphatase n=1 Tax=Sphaerimonospora mesophila TaxID=37483 RepID=UPI0006E25EF8
MHATAQLIGSRSHQCDATATHTHAGTRAYVLLDGIGSSDTVREWTRTAARRLARAAALQASAEGGLRTIHAVAAAECDYYGAPAAVAVVAVAAPGKPLEVAWCGDARAYLLTADGTLERLTKDHNMRQTLLDLGQEPDQYARNHVTSYLGDSRDAPAIGARSTAQHGRLLLASDGAYEPLEDDGCDLASYLTGSPRTAARALTTAAIGHATRHADNATVLVADLD